MRLLLLPLCLLLVFNLGAQDKPYVLSTEKPVLYRDAVSFKITAVEDLSNGDKYVGRAHTGMMNKARDIVIDGGVEAGLLTMLEPGMRQPEKNKPSATFNLLHLKLSETILATRETGRIEIAATLSITGEDGTTKHYGPVQFELTEAGGMNATARHDDRLDLALNNLLEQFEGAFRADETIDAAKPAYHPLEGEIANGAYRSALDFKMGITSPDLELVPKTFKLIDDYDGRGVSSVVFDRGPGVKKKDLGQLFGYHFDGRSYILVKNHFYEIFRLEDGRIVATLPRDLYTIATEQQLWGYAIGGVVGSAIASAGDGPNDLIRYTFKIESGEFIPIEELPGKGGIGPAVGPSRARALAAKRNKLRILEEAKNRVPVLPGNPPPTGLKLFLINTGETPVSIKVAGDAFELQAKEGLLFDNEIQVAYQNKGNDRAKNLKFYADRSEEVYSITGKDNKVKVDWVEVEDRESLLLQTSIKKDRPLAQLHEIPGHL